MPDPTNVSPEARVRRQRIKLAILILVFGPMVLYALFQVTYGAYRIIQGEPVGYRSVEERAGQE